MEYGVDCRSVSLVFVARINSASVFVKVGFLVDFISPLFFVDDVFLDLLIFTNIQMLLGQLSARCAVAQMKSSMSKSKNKVLSQERVDWSEFISGQDSIIWTFFLRLVFLQPG